MDLLKRIKKAKAVSVPIVAVSTADQNACEASIRAAINGSVPLIHWDMVAGARALNEVAQEALAACLGDSGADQVLDPADMMVKALRLPEGSLVLMHGAHMWLEGNNSARQALMNLRDEFKSNQRMLVLLSPELRIPAELQNSIETFDEALPTREQIASIVKALLEGASLPIKNLDDASEALVGLSAFAVEQCSAMSLTTEGIDLDTCWERKKRQVEQTPGLHMHTSKVAFKDVGGLVSIKTFFSRVFGGPKSPDLIVRMEEIEKLMAGSSGVGDNTGVSQDFLQVLLDRIESNGWLGALFLGPGGSGKSYFSEALAGEFGVKAISLDTGAMKTSALGASEQAIRASMKVIEAIGSDRVLICATCNGLQELRPELQRRLASAGMWFFDLPDDAEKKAIWSLQQSKFSLKALPGDCVPSDNGWSSSDIRDCCRTAYLLNQSLTDAAKYVNAATMREPERIESLRRLASGRLSSASYPGPYKYQSMSPVSAAIQGRAVNMKGE